MNELIKIQSELKAPKSQHNSYGNYDYRSCEDILGAVKPLLNKYSCTLTISDDVVMVGERIYIKAVATITNSKGVSEVTTAFAREEESKKGMDASQITGSASSYARKYALNGLFAIDDTKDADTLNTSDAFTKGAAPAKKANAIDIAKAAIEQARTKEDLLRIHNDFTVLHGNSDFLAALTAQRKKLGIKNSNEK